MKYRLLGVLLILNCGCVWAWMLGAFTPPSDGHVGQSSYMMGWTAPGFLGLPAMVATIAGFVGVLFVIGVFPLGPVQAPADDESK